MVNRYMVSRNSYTRTCYWISYLYGLQRENQKSGDWVVILLINRAFIINTKTSKQNYQIDLSIFGILNQDLKCLKKVK